MTVQRAGRTATTTHRQVSPQFLALHSIGDRADHARSRLGLRCRREVAGACSSRHIRTGASAVPRPATVVVQIETHCSHRAQLQNAPTHCTCCTGHQTGSRCAANNWTAPTYTQDSVAVTSGLAAELIAGIKVSGTFYYNRTKFYQLLKTWL